MEKPEIELIERSQNGDTKAFDELVRIHDQRVLQIAYGMLGNMQDAQDVYQEAFIRAYTKINSFRFESSFSTWLNKIVMNLSINRIRQRKLKNWFSIDQKKDMQESWDLQGTENGENKPDEAFMSEEFMNKLQSSLDVLSSQQRSVFVMKHIHGYKISEIAETLNISVGATKNQLFRATRKLRQSLKTYYSNNISI